VADEPNGSDELFEQLRAVDVQQFLDGTASTLASLALAKIERRELEQAKTAIDAVAALVPLVHGELEQDLKVALANLQVAYAAAVSAG
jgi:hypothetical protein